MSQDLGRLLRESRPPVETGMDVEAIVDRGLRRRRRRRVATAAGAVGVVVVAAVVGVVLAGGQTRVPDVADRPSGGATDPATPSEGAGSEMAVTEPLVASREVAERVVGGVDMVVGFGSVWVATPAGEVLRISEDLQAVEASPDVATSTLVVTGDGIWAGLADSVEGGFTQVVRIDPATSRVDDPISLDGFEASWMQPGDGALWFATRAPAPPRLLRVDPATRAVTGPWELDGIGGLTGFTVTDAVANVVDADGTYAGFPLPSDADGGRLAATRSVEVGGLSEDLAVDADGNVWLPSRQPAALRRLGPDDAIEVHEVAEGAVSVALAGPIPLATTDSRLLGVVDDNVVVVYDQSGRAGLLNRFWADDLTLWILGNDGLIRIPFVPTASSNLYGEILQQPQAGTREPGSSQVAGACPKVTSTDLVTVTINPDTPLPRCVQVGPQTRLRFVNNTHFFGEYPGEATSFTMTFAGWIVHLDPGEEVVLDLPAGDYLEPGSHIVDNGPAPEAEIVLTS